MSPHNPLQSAGRSPKSESYTYTLATLSNLHEELHIIKTKIFFSLPRIRKNAKQVPGHGTSFGLVSGANPFVRKFASEQSTILLGNVRPSMFGGF